MAHENLTIRLDLSAHAKFKSEQMGLLNLLYYAEFKRVTICGLVLARQQLIDVQFAAPEKDTPIRYTPMRCTPCKMCPPMRSTPLRCTL